MNAIRAVVGLFVVLAAGTACAQETIQLNAKLLSGFIGKHCSKCHGGDKPKGELRLDNLSPTISAGDTMGTWRRVSDALRDGSMPPEEEPRPDANELQAVIDHLTVAVSRSLVPLEPRPQYQSGDIEIPHATADEPKLPGFNQQAAAKYLDDGAIVWVRSYECITCHTTGTYMAERPSLTTMLGPPREEVHENFTAAVYEESDDKGDFWFVWRSLGLAEWDKHVTRDLSEPTAKALQEMFARQQSNGAWDIAQRRIQIPHVISEFELAVQAARAIAAAPGWLDNLEDQNVRDGVERLKAYFQTYQPRNDYERALLLRIDALLPRVVSPERREQSLAMLRRQQLSDGGWSMRRMSAAQDWSVRVDPRLIDTLQSKPDVDNPGSDPYMTALAIVLLREAGVPTADEQVQRGIAWLKSNQRQSGRWWLGSLTYPGNTRKNYTTYIATAQALRALHLCGELVPAAAAQK